MSSIPLPALSIRPAQIENPMDQYAKGLQMRQMEQQNQIGGVDLQQKQQALKDQQAMTAAMHSWDGKDYDALLPLVIKNGASANAVIGLKQHLLEQQEKKSIIAKNDSDTGAKNVETTIKKNDMINGAIGGLLDLPDEQLPAGTAAKAQELAQQGILDPQHLQAVQNIMQLPVPQMRDQLKILQKTGMLESQQWEKAKADAQAFKDTQQGLEAKSKVDSGATIPVDQREMNDWLQKNPGKGPADYEQAKETKTSTQSDSLGVTSSTTSRPSLTTGGRGPVSSLPAPSLLPPGSGKMTPDQVRNNIVDMVGQYRYNPSQLARLQAKHPEIIAAINQKYPDWDQTTYQAKAKLMQDYTSGVHSKEINAINTTMGHVGELGDAIDALNNGNIKVLNGMANKLGIQVGQTPAATFQLIARRVGPEIATVYTPGGGGEAERFANEKDFDSSLSPDILKKNVGMTVTLLRSKIGALENQYQNTVGRNDFAERFITPQAKGALQKYSPQAGQQQQGAPQAGGPNPYSHLGAVPIK